MDKIQICVVGWHLNKNCYNFLKNIKDEYDILVVSHKEANDFYKKYNLKNITIENIGLEFHCFNEFILKYWNMRSDVILMQDDLHFFPENNDYYSIIEEIEIKTRDIDQCYIFQSEEDKKYDKGLVHGRMIFMKKDLCEWFVYENNGIWFDENNLGDVTPWNEGINRGIKVFRDTVNRAQKFGFKTGSAIFINSIEILRRGLIEEDFKPIHQEYLKRKKGKKKYELS